MPTVLLPLRNIALLVVVGIGLELVAEPAVVLLPDVIVGSSLSAATFISATFGFDLNCFLIASPTLASGIDEEGEGRGHRHHVGHPRQRAEGGLADLLAYLLQELHVRDRVDVDAPPPRDLEDPVDGVGEAVLVELCIRGASSRSARWWACSRSCSRPSDGS